MIVLKKEGNLVFQVPVVDESCLQQFQGKCLLNGKIMNNDYFEKISLKKFNYNKGYEYNTAVKYVSQLKSTADFVGSNEFYNFNEKKASLKNCDVSSEYVIEIYEFKLLNPGITQFFVSGLDFNKSKITDNMHFDFTTLINSNENNIEEIDCILSLPKPDVIKKLLYKLYPELAIFYYEVYPYITFKEIENYNIAELQKLRMTTEALRVNTYYIDQLLDYLPTAENNTELLRLLNNSKK